MQMLTGHFMGRSEALRLIQPHLGAIAAIGLAADEAAHEFCRWAVPSDQKADVVPKMLGNMRTVMWTNGMGMWARSQPGLYVHAPYRWVELLVHGRIHLRLEADPNEPRSERRRKFRAQLPDESLPPQLLDGQPLSVELVPHYSEVTGRLRDCTLRAPLSSDEVWDPYWFSLGEARRQLDSWRRRDAARVPWLDMMPLLGQLAELSPMLDQVPAGASPQRGGDLRPAAYTAPPRPTFGTNLSRGTQRDAQSE
mgnify:CR=1 FL=1